MMCSWCQHPTYSVAVIQYEQSIFIFFFYSTSGFTDEPVVILNVNSWLENMNFPNESGLKKPFTEGKICT